MRYDKGRKDASRRRIVEVAAERFRTDGIAATGLARIMSEAGLTNGALYPHFSSKAALIGESLSLALQNQSEQLEHVLTTGGVLAAIDAYLSPQHRDQPGLGCASAALLPEVSREPAATRQIYAENFTALARQLSTHLPSDLAEREAVAISILVTLIGTLQLARAVQAKDSDRILEAGAKAARTLARMED